jgi:hypothetical protein
MNGVRTASVSTPALPSQLSIWLHTSKSTELRGLRIATISLAAERQRLLMLVAQLHGAVGRHSVDASINGAASHPVSAGTASCHFHMPLIPLRDVVNMSYVFQV